MKIKLDLNEEFTDRILIAKLKEHIKYKKEDIKNLNRIHKTQKLKPYQLEDMKNFRMDKKAMEQVLHYFGGDL
jgi:hypothetical protein